MSLTVDSFQGADPNIVNNDGFPALSLAVMNKHEEAVPVLIEAGAKLDKKGRQVQDFYLTPWLFL